MSTLAENFLFSTNIPEKPAPSASPDEFSVGLAGAALHPNVTLRKKVRPKAQSATFQAPKKPWFLHMEFDLGLRVLLSSGGSSVVSMMKYLKACRTDNNMTSHINMLCPTEAEKTAMLNKCVALTRQNQKCLMAFRALANKWLARHMRTGNEEDLVTGEAPKKPVTLTIMSERSKYCFEATTILRDMTERLLQHSYLFAKFMLPRNPYTNVNLTQGQFFSVVQQLRAAGVTNWLVEALYSLQYNIARFKEQFGEAVKRDIITRQFRNIKADETIALISDFIEEQHDNHDKFYNERVYLWGLRQPGTCQRLRDWIKYCKQYNMAVATIRDVEQLAAEMIRIEKLTRNLCSPPFEIIRQRDAELKKELLAEREPVADQTIIEHLIESFREDVTQPTTEDQLLDRITGRDLVTAAQPTMMDQRELISWLTSIRVDALTDSDQSDAESPE